MHALSRARGSGILKPLPFTPWPRISLRSALNSSPQKISGKKTSHRASSIGPMREPTPGTFLCRYCHSIWSDIPNPEYADWEYRLANLSMLWTQCAHASTLVRTQAYSSSLDAGTTNPGGTWKPDNTLKGISNPIPQNLDNPHKGI